MGWPGLNAWAFLFGESKYCIIFDLSFERSDVRSKEQLANKIANLGCSYITGQPFFILLTMKTVNQVYSTTDYSLFKSLTGNRAVNNVHVRRLRESFKSTYLLSPIIVNEKYEIIDGQHRFEATKELGLSVNFIVCKGYSLSEVQVLNTNMKNWKSEDYLNAYCDLGYPDYLKFREFMKKFPDFGFAPSQIILTNLCTTNRAFFSNEIKTDSNKKGAYTERYFQEGRLSIPDYQQSIVNAEKILEVKPYYEGFNRRIFVAAMIGLFKVPHYSHERLIQRISSNPTSMQHCSNVSQYKLMIEEIYNFRSREKVSLRF